MCFLSSTLLFTAPSCHGPCDFVVTRSLCVPCCCLLFCACVGTCAQLLLLREEKARRRVAAVCLRFFPAPRVGASHSRRVTLPACCTVPGGCTHVVPRLAYWLVSRRGSQCHPLFSPAALCFFVTFSRSLVPVSSSSPRPLFEVCSRSLSFRAPRAAQRQRVSHCSAAPHGFLPRGSPLSNNTAPPAPSRHCPSKLAPRRIRSSMATVRDVLDSCVCVCLYTPFVLRARYVRIRASTCAFSWLIAHDRVRDRRVKTSPEASRGTRCVHAHRAPGCSRVR